MGCWVVIGGVRGGMDVAGNGNGIEVVQIRGHLFHMARGGIGWEVAARWRWSL